MWNIEKVILVTNNDKVYEKYKNMLQCVFVEKYEEVLIKVRNFVYDRYILLTHPQASSLKPNQTPYRSVMVYPRNDGEDNTKDILLIEKCIETFRQWQDIARTPENYERKVTEDFKTIDLSVIDNIIPRII
ncbi:GrdX protein [Leptotrichia sp. OH3620_COT-345]|uniref:GrdX family protein n=1 Tax=Leptotrichia sp. OH3620_COT-345 TaxID=2491048 RepID=UPI000F652D91|nr:GrdX family protein [Leptotrichia sp. OH3620_COT-345]RRD39625.1 GrdX protein [Leptotrichia sp. OH3620_COT-345]